MLSPAEARALLRWKFPDSDRQRVDQLSEQARAGKLSAAEQRELDEYLAIESALITIAVLQVNHPEARNQRTDLLKEGISF